MVTIVVHPTAVILSGSDLATGAHMLSYQNTQYVPVPWTPSNIHHPTHQQTSWQLADLWSIIISYNTAKWSPDRDTHRLSASWFKSLNEYLVLIKRDKAYKGKKNTSHYTKMICSSVLLVHCSGHSSSLRWFHGLLQTWVRFHLDDVSFEAEPLLYSNCRASSQ